MARKRQLVSISIVYTLSTFRERTNKKVKNYSRCEKHVLKTTKSIGIDKYSLLNLKKKKKEEAYENLRDLWSQRNTIPTGPVVFQHCTSSTWTKKTSQPSWANATKYLAEDGNRPPFRESSLENEIAFCSLQVGTLWGSVRFSHQVSRWCPTRPHGL